MLELITSDGSVSIRDADQDYALTHKYSGIDTLHFEIDLEDPVFSLLTLEAPIYETTERQTYLIKGIDAGEHRAGVDCELLLDEWKADLFLQYTNHTAALPDTLEPILPTGWTIAWEASFPETAEINLEGGTPLEIFLRAQEKFGCAMRFDTEARVCRIYRPYDAPLGTTALCEGASLLCRPQYMGRSSGLVTRLYPVGANGLTIGSINGGKNYVDDHSFTDKVICELWQDERYTIPENLMAAAKKRLASLAMPNISWELSLFDLYRLDPARFPDQQIRLLFQVQFPYGGRQISALCVEETVHPHRPEHNTVCIGAVPASVMSSLRGLTEDLRSPNSTYNSMRDAAVQHATQKIVGSAGGRVVLVLDGDGKPKELCILSDGDSIENARGLWRWNEGGLGYSKTGYNGSYGTAITNDGRIVADAVTAGTMNAGVIRAGLLTDAKGKNYWNLDTGAFSLSAGANISAALDQEGVFSALTGGGQNQGIYLSDGRLYINGTYIQAGRLNADHVDLTGRFAVYTGNTLGGFLGFMSGSTGTETTEGIGICDPTGQCYVIITNEGVRLHAGSTEVYAVKDKDVHIIGDLRVTGNVYGSNID